MKYNFKDISSLTEIDEMTEYTLDNIDNINKLSNELEKLRITDNPLNQEQKYHNEVVIKEEIPSETPEETDNSLLEEINYYYLRIRDFDLSENKEKLDEFRKELPSKRKSNYQDIILGIQAFFIKDINEIRNFIETEKNIISPEELADFKKDIIDIQRKINTIFKINHENNLQSEEIINNEKLNNIVFLETTSGNIYALEDLDNNSVPTEYYEGFNELIQSIEDGTFKNVKHLNGNNNGTAGISEVKGFKKRVIFDRVGYDTYVIIGAFIKKSDKDKSYLDPLKNRIATYRKNRDDIVKMVKEKESYIDSQREILEQVYKLLEPNSRKRG